VQVRLGWSAAGKLWLSRRWFLIQLVNLGAIAQQASTGGVAYAAHVGGFIFGAVTVRLFEGRSQLRLAPG
jgi:membrane associated rhomboid family serine protease